MEYFVSPKMILEQMDAEQARMLQQAALCAEASQSAAPRPGVRHALATVLRELAIRIDSQAAAPDVPGVVTQS